MKTICTTLAVTILLTVSGMAAARGLYLANQIPDPLVEIKPVTVLVDAINCDVDSHADISVRYLLEKPSYAKHLSRNANGNWVVDSVTVEWVTNLVKAIPGGSEIILRKNVNSNHLQAFANTGKNCQWLAKRRRDMIVEEFDIV